MSLLADLADPRVKRSKSAHKLAACVVADPARIVSMSTAALAALAQVSEPTVNRFCTGLGYKGFPDFKLALAGELARQQPRIAENIGAGDSVAQVITKVFEGTHAALHDAQQHLDLGAVHDAVDALASARTITLCGLGASASVALDAQHKLLRFPVPVAAHTDIINQRMAVTGLRGRDCLVCISYTGRTEAIVDLALLGGETGARVIGITTPGSPLATASHIVLGVQGGEDTDLYTPMTSRIAQLVLVDALATCLALRQEPGFSTHLQRLKDNLAATRRPR